MTITPKTREMTTRRLSRNETHDLSMIIKDRTKVLEAHVDEQAAKCLAIETKLIEQQKNTRRLGYGGLYDRG